MSGVGIVRHIDYSGTDHEAILDVHSENGMYHSVTVPIGQNNLCVGDTVELDSNGEAVSVNSVNIDWSLSTGLSLGDYNFAVGDSARIADLGDPVLPSDIVDLRHVASPTGTLRLDRPLYPQQSPRFGPLYEPSHSPEFKIHTRDPDRMIVNAIAAVGENNQLALNNRLPWKYPEDLELYHGKVKDKAVIMGRSTFESVPTSFYEIPSDIIVVSSTMDDSDREDIHIADSVAEAIGIADDMECKEVWICGGVGIYKEALEQELIEELHISHIPYEGEADRFFPNFTKYIYDVKEGTTIECKDQPSFVYKIYEMKEETGQMFVTGLMDTSQNPIDINSVNPTEIRYDNHSAGLVSTNVQDALSELDNSISGLRLITDPRQATVGDMYYNENDGAMYVSTEDGPMRIETDIETNGSYTVTETEEERLHRVIRETADSFLQGTVTTIIRDDTLPRLHEMIEARVRTEFPEAVVTSNISVDNQVQPIYTMGYAAVDYAPGQTTTRLNVRVEILYNTYEINLDLY